VKPGDYFEDLKGIISGLIIREMSFKEYCEKHDDLELEYDIEDAWDAWEKNGPCFEVLNLDGRLIVVWRNETR
tara:strand:- start:17522 stop:17740 length:219 start_codon:yes stop_codon:yes gene_type:complete